MTKNELVKKVAKKTGHTDTEVRAIINAMVETIKDSLYGGINVYIKGFINFEIKRKPEKTMNNPRGYGKITIPKRYIVKVSSLPRSFKERLAKKEVY